MISKARIRVRARNVRVSESMRHFFIKPIPDAPLGCQDGERLYPPWHRSGRALPAAAIRPTRRRPLQSGDQRHHRPGCHRQCQFRAWPASPGHSRPIPAAYRWDLPVQWFPVSRGGFRLRPRPAPGRELVLPSKEVIAVDIAVVVAVHIRRVAARRWETSLPAQKVVAIDVVVIVEVGFDANRPAKAAR